MQTLNRRHDVASDAKWCGVCFESVLFAYVPFTGFQVKWVTSSQGAISLCFMMGRIAAITDPLN